MATRVWWLTAVLMASTALGAAADWPYPADQVEVVRITPGTDRKQHEGLQALLSSEAAERVAGNWGYVPPTGDPAQVRKEDYLKLAEEFPGPAYYTDRYGQDPDKADGNGYEAMPIFIAKYKQTGDRQWLEYALTCVKKYCRATEEEIANLTGVPGADGNWSSYWRYDLAYVMIPLLEVQDTPEFAEATRLIGKAFGERANVWPLAPFRGAYNMAIDAAFWYDVALKYNPDIPRAAELKAYADDIWAAWDQVWDTEEDDPNYTTGDMIVLHAWCLIRGEKWWEGPQRATMWRDYAEQVGNDGSWPAYGDGGNIGRFFIAQMISEMSARYLREGRYKWFARRAFWNGKDRIRPLCLGIGYAPVMYSALAYLFADDTIQEVPPEAGVVLTTRHWHDLTPAEVRAGGGSWFVQKDQVIPSKLMFRAGGGELDNYLLVQANQQSGHGHTDSSAILGYGGDLAYYLNYATLRLDNYMEAHNLVALRDPTQPERPWPGNPGGLYCTEEVTVPTKGTTSQASYARVHVAEYPGQPATPELWETVKNWTGNWTLEKAIGYKNWPVRVDRSVVFTHNQAGLRQFTVVRDVVTPTLEVPAMVGPNWTFGELGAVGPNWVNVWMPKTLNGWFGSLRQGADGSWERLSPITTAARDLLIWFVPQAGATLQIEKLNQDRSGYDCYVPANSDINLQLRAWYHRTGTWPAGKPVAFTTVLIPHEPTGDGCEFGAGISVVRDGPEGTILSCKEGNTERLVILNSGGKPVSVGALEIEAEAAIVTYLNGKRTHLAGWGVKSVRLGEETLFRSTQRVTVDRELE